MSKIYIVKYSSDSYEDYTETEIFATFDKEKAEKYIKKFNSLLDKWKKYFFKRFGENTFYMNENNYYIFDRYMTITDINRCFLTEIKIRQ
jgi:hypothetical protein